MADGSKIEWTDSTYNPIRARNLKTGKVGWHCEHVTPGCEHCYAEGLNMRLGTDLPFKPGHRKDVEIFLDDTMLTLPLRWKKPRKIFVGSMTDLFADFVTDEMLDRVFAVMALSPQHTFQVLTKRAERMRAYFHDGRQNVVAWGPVSEVMEKWHPAWQHEEINGPYRSRAIAAATTWPLPNVWLGVSCENQEQADARIPLLLQTPAAVRFVSAEPLLGAVDLIGTLARYQDTPNRHCAVGLGKQLIDWVIVGGESGPKARPMHPDWARGLRDQCAAAGVAFHFKQWGEFHPSSQHDPATCKRTETPAAIHVDGRREWVPSEQFWLIGSRAPGWAGMCRVGKKAAGRLLDGVQHNAFPAGRA